MTKRSQVWLMRWLLLTSRRKPQSGFTLIELLVALVVGSLIVSVLLFGVVELLQTNQRENSRAETQRNMQAALDYISTELREAIFVYDGACLAGPGTFDTTTVNCPGVLNFLPAGTRGGNQIPVLAFWRVDDLPQVLIQRCVTNATSLNANPLPAAINGVPCLSRRTYSLVLYYLDTDNSNSTWRGLSRIRRYELTQFNATTGNPNPGWVDPTTTANNFLSWPFSAAGTNLQTAATLPDGSTNPNAGTPTGIGDPLVDFVDTPTVGSANACPGTSASTNLPAFVRSPTSGSTSFYACVRGGGIIPATTSGGNTTPAEANNPGGRNQEVALFIRGNAAGQPGIPVNTAARITFEMETRALSRGSYVKTPAAQ